MAYKANLTGNNIMDNFYGYIDCETGDMVFVQPLVYRTNSTGTANTIYSGIRTITSDSYSGSFRLQETSRGGTNTAIQTYNYQRSPAYYTSDVVSGIASAIDFADNDNTWTLAEYNNPNHDNAALDAHWGAEMTFDYFRTVHNRNSYDNNNGTIKGYVHVRTRNGSGDIIDMDNAFWLDSYKSMFYGDGFGSGPTVSLDICGHEIAHAVCNSSVGNGAGLIYSKESGALNESLSDIWGACVEQWSTTGKQTWLLGEDVFIGGIRSMNNPNLFNQPDTYHGTNWANTECGTPSDANDHCGVHTNSGVGNFWFFLLAQGGSGTNDIGNPYDVRGIGITNAARILYRMETNYLISSSTYNDSRSASILAATNLFGTNSCEVINTTNAWHAVGVGAPFQYTNVAISGPALVCPSGATFTLAYLPAGATGTWTSTSTNNNLNINPTTGYAYATNSDEGTGTVTAIIHTGCEDITLPVKNVNVGSLPTPNITGVANVRCGHMLPYHVDQINAVYGTTFSWSSDNLSIINSEIPQCTASGTFNGDADISCTVTACGVSKTGTKLVHVSLCDYLLFSPNPATDETTVSIESETQKNAIIANGWDMEVYDQSQLLKIKKTKLKDRITTLNTSGWKDGVYIVRAHIGEEWISEKLVVQH